MAYVTAHTAPSLLSRIRAVVASFAQERANWTQYNRTVAELGSLADHELADIGVRRCDIADIAHEHAFGK